MVRSLALLALGLVLLPAAPLDAEEAILGELYGTGVHAYFSREYRQAHQHLTSAVDGGTRDPRTYYFRGMTFLRLGRPEEAKMDFQKGAELESRDVNRTFDVARSLARIQGRPRLELEKYRLKARMAARQRAEQIQKVRYDSIRAEEGRLLREEIEQAPALPPGTPVGPPAESADADPFGVGPMEEPAADPDVAAGPSPEEPPAATPDTTDPFGMPPAAVPETTPVTPDPLDVPPAATPAATPAAEPVTAKDAGGVFSGLGSAFGKAVAGGGEEPAEMPAEDDPFPGGFPEPAAGDDPFSEGFPEPAAEPAAGDDPFSEDLPEPAAEPAAGDDPFADGPMEPTAEPAAGDDPFSEDLPEPAAEPAAGDDPFADDLPEPAGEPAAGSDDPFAEDEPAPPAPPAGGAGDSAVDPDDPFSDK